MKKLFLILTILMLASVNSFAHYLWIETNPIGKEGEEQEVKVFFGEYTYGEIEEANSDAFVFVKDFTLWVVDAKGSKTEITVKAANDHFVGHFTPQKKGVYTVALDNNNIDVIDYTKYDFGIFKTHYHAVAKVNIGVQKGITIADNNSGITLKDISENNDEVKLQVLFKNKPLAKNELKVFITNAWIKTLETDENGFVSFKKMWDAKYIVETTFSERTLGTYKGEDYEFIWHCVTYSTYK